MPTQVVELDDLVPDAIEFRYQGKSYTLPGDITVEDTFKLQRALRALLAAEKEVATGEPDATKEKEHEKSTLEVEQLLLSLFRKADPELESLDFGVVGFRYVLVFLLRKLGFADEPDPPKPPPNRATRRAAAKGKNKSRSPRSNTSGS